MEIPAPQAGLVKALNISVGDKVSEGSAIVTLETDAEQASQAEVSTPDEPPPAVEAVVTPDAAEEVESVEPISNATEVLTEAVKVPDLGGATGVEVIEVNIAVGDQVNKEDTLIVLESDKASMEIPSSVSGTVKSLQVKVGDKLDEGAVIAELELKLEAGGQPKTSASRVDAPVSSATDKAAIPQAPEKPPAPVTLPVSKTGGEVYAGFTDRSEYCCR